MTIALVLLQLGGCALDLASHQISLLALFCMATVPDNPALEWIAGGIWIVLSLAWVVGLLAVFRAAVRPVYWGLVLLIPIAFLTQQVMLDQEIFFCDAP